MSDDCKFAASMEIMKKPSVKMNNQECSEQHQQHADGDNDGAWRKPPIAEVECEITKSTDCEDRC